MRSGEGAGVGSARPARCVSDTGGNGPPHKCNVVKLTGFEGAIAILNSEVQLPAFPPWAGFNADSEEGSAPASCRGFLLLSRRSHGDWSLRLVAGDRGMSMLNRPGNRGGSNL